MSEERQSAYGPYLPQCEKHLCRDHDAHVCACMKDEAHWSDWKTPSKWCPCNECHGERENMSVKEQVAEIMAAWAKRADQLASRKDLLEREAYELVERLEALGCIVSDLSHEVKDGQVYCNVRISIPKD